MDVNEIVRMLGMNVHPEGGYFVESYRAKQIKDTIVGNRSVCTAIYYLLPKGAKSRLHRIKSDEIWHFYLGGPLVVGGIDFEGKPYEVKVGPDLKNGEQLQFVVPKGNWFGAYPSEGTEFALVGCTVAPGFEFEDLEMGVREDLLAQYPEAQSLIEKLT